MTRELIDRLRLGLETFNRTGESPTGFLAPEFELPQASSIIDTAGVFRGPDAMRGSLNELRASFESLSFEASGFSKHPAVRLSSSFTQRAAALVAAWKSDNHIAWVWTFRGEKAVRLVVYEDPAEALEAVGLQK